MRNTRTGRPVLILVTLKTITWMITDSVTITNRPPKIGSSSSVRDTIARPARAPPRASAPTSPNEDPGRRRVPPQEAGTRP